VSIVSLPCALKLHHSSNGSNEVIVVEGRFNTLGPYEGKQLTFLTLLPLPQALHRVEIVSQFIEIIIKFCIELFSKLIIYLLV